MPKTKTKKKPNLDHWTPKNSAAALSTGWDVFLTDRDEDFGKPEKERLEIQMDDEADMFQSDMAARHYVARCAARGWFIAKKALRITGACILCGDKHSRDVACQSAPPVQPWCEGPGYHDSAGSCCRDLTEDKE